MKDNNNTIRIAALTNVGMERDHNEDNFLVGKDLTTNDWLLTMEPYQPGSKGALLLVADGMGGTNAGEVASAIAIAAIQEYFSNLPLIPPADEAGIQDILKDSILFANTRLIEHAKLNKETKGMGTTLIMSWIIGSSAYTCWSGDSRAYIFRKGKGIKQISKDHSFVQQLVDKGSITEEQAFYHPDSNIITQSLGDSKRLPDPDFIAEPLEDGDIILLCSDGLNGMIQNKEIENILTQNPDIEICKEVLVAEANKAGGHDNITVVLAEIIKIAAKHIPAGNYKKAIGVNDKKAKHNWRRIGILSSIGLILLIALLWYIIPFKTPEDKTFKKNALADSIRKRTIPQKITTKDSTTKTNENQQQKNEKKLEKKNTDTTSNDDDTLNGIINQIHKQLKKIEDSTKKFNDIELKQKLKKARTLNIDSSSEEINKSLNDLITTLSSNETMYKMMNPIIGKLEQLQNQLIKTPAKSKGRVKT